MTSRPRNQDLVLSALRGAAKPLTAYGLLDALREDGLKAPTQVYRALDQLIEAGHVHRIESLNAFMACTAGHSHAGGVTVFMLCERCGVAEEFADRPLSARLGELCAERDFQAEKMTVEIRGACAECQTA